MLFIVSYYNIFLFIIAWQKLYYEFIFHISAGCKYVIFFNLSINMYIFNYQHIYHGYLHHLKPAYFPPEDPSAIPKFQEYIHGEIMPESWFFFS